MINDIDWTKTGNSERCISNSEQVKNYAKRFTRGHWTIPGPGDEKKWYGTLSYTPEGKWDSVATESVGRFKETGHPVLKNISALSRGFRSESKRIDFGKVRSKRERAATEKCETARGEFLGVNSMKRQLGIW